MLKRLWLRVQVAVVIFCILTAIAYLLGSL
jgi:hypothetical protein